MLKIRLARLGAKKNPFYHIQVTSSRNPRDGRFIEKVGYLNPCALGQEKRLHLDMAKVNDWRGKGAQMTARVAALVKEFTAPPKTTEGISS